MKEFSVDVQGNESLFHFLQDEAGKHGWEWRDGGGDVPCDPPVRCINFHGGVISYSVHQRHEGMVSVQYCLDLLREGVERKIIINNHPVEFRLGHITIGCETIGDETIQEIYKRYTAKQQETVR